MAVVGHHGLDPGTFHHPGDVGGVGGHDQAIDHGVRPDPLRNAVDEGLAGQELQGLVG
jgi:hypothetical protein